MVSGQEKGANIIISPSYTPYFYDSRGCIKWLSSDKNGSHFWWNFAQSVDSTGCEYIFYEYTVTERPGKLAAGLLGEELDECRALSKKGIFFQIHKSVKLTDFSVQRRDETWRVYIEEELR